MDITELYNHYHKYTCKYKITLHCNISLSHTMQVQPQALARSWTQVKGARVQITLVSMLIVNICILC